LPDESPPVTETGVNDERAEDAQDSQHNYAENVRSADFYSRHLDPAREAETDTQQDW